MKWLRSLGLTKKQRTAKKESFRFIDFARACVQSAEELSSTEKSKIASALNELKTGAYSFESLDQTLGKLRRVWDPPAPSSLRRSRSPNATPAISVDSAAESARYQEESSLTILHAPKQQYWLIAMSKDFIKAIDKIDRKLQGRILEAISDISQAPLKVRGDTVKPLTRELYGLWRYRLGDYRLLYQPWPEKQQILLVNFESRGDVYG